MSAVVSQFSILSTYRIHIRPERNRCFPAFLLRFLHGIKPHAFIHNLKRCMAFYKFLQYMPGLFFLHGRLRILVELLAQTVNHIRKLFISCDMDLRNCNIRKCYNFILRLSARIRMLMFHISLTMRSSSNMHFRDCQIIKCKIKFRFFLLLFLVLHAIPPTVISISR